MRDPHIHAEKTVLPGFGNAAMRELIAGATGLACDLPKTVGTGCGRRRPFAMTSTIPEHITCLACREWAAQQHDEAAQSAEMLVELVQAGDPTWVTAKTSPEQMRDQARKDRDLAARYRGERS